MTEQTLIQEIQTLPESFETGSFTFRPIFETKTSR